MRLGRLADISCIVLMVVYNVVAHAAVVSAIVNFNLPPVPALVLSVEQVRGQPPSLTSVNCCWCCPTASIYNEELFICS